MLIQVLLVLAVLGILFWFVRSSNAVYVQASKRVALVLFLLVNIYAVMRPDDLSALARLVGVGRGTDLVLYALVIAFLFSTLGLYQRLRKLEDRYVELARRIAIDEALRVSDQETAPSAEPGVCASRLSGADPHRAAS